MAKFDDYTQKNTPEDNDITLILDKTANVNKKTPFSGVWNWIVSKLTSAVISQLETTNKSIVPAINELNSNIDMTFENYTGDDIDARLMELYENIGNQKNKSFIFRAVDASDSGHPFNSSVFLVFVFRYTEKYGFFVGMTYNGNRICKTNVIETSLQPWVFFNPASS